MSDKIDAKVPDCRPDNTGLDDGPYLPGRAPRKRPRAKSSEELSAIRAKAWATRRAEPDPTTPEGRVALLKALWRSDPLLSGCAPLAGKLAAIEAAKAGASPIEANYVGQGWRLPDGCPSWEHIASRRRYWSIDPVMVPIATSQGGFAWGVPLINGEYLLHP